MPDPTSDLPTGARVVLRRRLAADELGPGGERLTDVVGDLTGADPTHLVVGTRGGEVTVARRDVIAAKVIPPRPTRRGETHRVVGVAELERLTVEGNPPLERAWLGGWLLRAGGGYTARANSVLPLGDPARPLGDALEAAEQWYRDRGLRPLVAVYGPEGAEIGTNPLGAGLLARGYTPMTRAFVMTAAVADIDVPARLDGVRVEVSTELGDAWLAASDGRADEHPEAARTVIGGPPRQAFLLARDDRPRGEALGVVRAPVSGTWGGLFGLHVRPAARRRGLGRALTAAAVAQLRDAGATSVYLQVTRDNVDAIRLYAAMGFTTHHEYVYLGA